MRGFRYFSFLFYLCIFSFFLGVAGASVFRSFFDLGTVLFLLFLSFLFSFWWKEGFVYGLLSVFLFCLSLGVLRTALFFNSFQILPDSFVGESSTFSGVIASSPEKREKSVQFIFNIESFGGEKLQAPLPIMVFMSPGQTLFKGERLRVLGKLEKPEAIVSLDGDVFDWPRYLETKKIIYITSFPRIVVVQGRKNLFYYFDTIKNLFSLKIKEILPDPEASFLQGILLGITPASRDLEDSFKKAGVVHVLVLSGYNLTVIMWALASLTYFISRRFALLLGILGAFLFIGLVGPTLPLLRALGMTVLSVFAELIGGRASASRTVWMVGFVLVFCNPSIFMFDPSFQLSFLATLGLMYGVPVFKRIPFFVKKPLFIKEILITTLSAQFFVLPLLLFYTGAVTPYFLIANLFVLPLIPFGMFLGFCAGLIGFILPFALFVVVVPLFLLLKTALLCIYFVGSLPGAIFFIARPSGFVIFCLYVVLLLFCVFRGFPPKNYPEPLFF